ncbi:MAG: 50S ribosomal protein L29 [Myxococcota bacterium]
MKAKDLRGLQPDELEARIVELTAGLFDVRIKHATGQLENTADLRRARRDLARALTIRSGARG